MINSEEIRKKYGDYLYYRAMSIPEWYIKRTGIEVDSNGLKQVDFSVDIFYSGNFRVSFIIDMEKLFLNVVIVLILLRIRYVVIF